MSRRLLILSHFFPPLAGGGVHRALGFTRHLPSYGWQCTVVCAGADDYWVTDPSLLERVHPETEVIRVGGGSALSTWLRVRRGDRGRRSGSLFSGLRALSDWWLIPDAYVGWSKRARAAAARRLAGDGIDAVLSTSPPDSVHLAAAALRGAGGPPWVADFRDPWISLHLRQPPTAWHRRRHAALERRVLQGADRVLVASRTHGEWIARDLPGVATGRVAHLPNGYEPGVDSAGASEASGDAVERAEDDGHFVMVFTGTLSLMPDTLTFFDALHELLERHSEARRKIRVRLAGPYDADYRDRVLALGMSGIVRFDGPRPHAQARALQRRADLLLLWKPRGSPTMVPGKLYEYLDAARPIVAVLEAGEEAARMAAEAGADVTAPADARALSALLERHYAAWAGGQPLGARRPTWLPEHTRARLSQRLAVLLDTLVS